MSQKPCLTPGGVYSTPAELENRQRVVTLLRHTPIPDEEMMRNLPVYLNRQALSHVLAMDFLYRLVLPIHGIVMEFGILWGRNMSLITALRGIYEPYNFNRRLVGFDTFSGFPAVATQDGCDPLAVVGGQGDRKSTRL